MRKLMLVIACLAATAVPAARAGAVEPRVRRNVVALSPAERAAYVDAVLRLKRTPSPYEPSLSWYDQFVAWHVYLSRCELGAAHISGHGGPMFLPWHRQFVLAFEDALRTVGSPDITVPYWDWTDPAATASVFADDFMGGDGDPARGYAVTSGPFSDWPIVVQDAGLWNAMGTPYLARHFDTADPLPSVADVAGVLGVPTYDVAPFNDSSDHAASFRNALEGWANPEPGATMCTPEGTHVTLPVGPLTMHNEVHTWVGGVVGTAPDGAHLLGTMSVPSASPNDPVFFLHHAQIDRLWAHWQDVHGTDTFEPAHEAHHAMTPFPARVTPSDVADVRALGYRYDDQPPEAPGTRPAWSCSLR